MNATTSKGVWEQRWHPLREQWVIIAAHRQHRPWSGEMLDTSAKEKPSYVDDCYLCPGNERVGGHRNDDYEGVFVFDNDLPSVGANAPTELSEPIGIYKNRPANGLARVICYSPQYAEQTGKAANIFSGSSMGAAEFGVREMLF